MFYVFHFNLKIASTQQNKLHENHVVDVDNDGVLMMTVEGHIYADDDDDYASYHKHCH